MEIQGAGIAVAMMACTACANGQPPPVEAAAPVAEPPAAAAAQPEAESTPYDEAIDRLLELKAGASSYATAHAAFPIGTVAVIPSINCCKQNYQGSRRCAPDARTFSDPLWKDLSFFPPVAPHYFQYMYVGSSQSFVLTATGDVDCDSTSITYTLTGSRLSDGRIVIEQTEPALGTD